MGGGNAPPIFVFAPPPDLFLAPPTLFCWEEEAVFFLAGKNVEIRDFRQKKHSDFGEDLFFFFFGDHLLLAGKKRSNFGQKKPSEIGENLGPPPDFNFAPPPPISRSWRRP